jgi:phosphoglycerate kinase
MTKLRLQDLDLKGKKVLMRVDFNVPLRQDGTISDDTRLRESLPSIEHIIQSGGSAILMSHLGRPKGITPSLSLKPCAQALSQLLNHPVLMAEDCTGEQTQTIAHHLKPGNVLLLENLRFYPAEETPASDPSFAKQLASMGDIYVNDAFGTAHRSHASTATITAYFPGKAAAGLLLQKEILYLSQLIDNPKPPFYAIIGGSKISSKLGVLTSLLSKVQGLFIGGAMAFTFFKAQGLHIGNSFFEKDQLPIALSFIKACAEKKIPLWLPSDIVIGQSPNNDTPTQTVLPSEGIPDGWQGMDIGQKTVEEWHQILQNAATLFWNGPLGIFEIPRFARGTQQIAHSLSELNATTIIGGGDSVAAIHQFGLSKKFSHLSTGGGAALEYIEFGHLPGIDALSDVK